MDRLYIASTKESRHADQKTGGQTVSSEQGGIQIYTDQQTGVDRQYCVHYYMHNKHEGIQTYWSTSRCGQTIPSTSLHAQQAWKDPDILINKQADRLQLVHTWRGNTQPQTHMDKQVWTDYSVYNTTRITSMKTIEGTQTYWSTNRCVQTILCTSLHT